MNRPNDAEIIIVIATLTSNNASNNNSNKLDLQEDRLSTGLLWAYHLGGGPAEPLNTISC